MADANETVLGANGKVYVGFVGATAPTNSTAPPAGAFVDLGYVTDDGLTFSDESDKILVRAWQSRRPIRRIAGDATTMAAFSLLQWNSDSFVFAFGGGSVNETGGASTYTPDPDEDDFRALIVDWEDNGKHYRLYFPRGIVSGSIEVALTGTNVSPLPVEFEAMPESDEDDPWLLFTDDPAFTDAS